jgi:hypothetical protein
VGRLAAVPWLLATGEDFRFPEVRGARPRGVGLLNRFFAHVLEICGHDAALAARFLAVMNFRSGPLVMLHPSVFWKVWRHARGARPATFGSAPREESLAASPAPPRAGASA